MTRPWYSLDHGADLAQARVDGRPVLVVVATGLVVAKFRVLGEPVDGVDAEAVDATVEPEAQHVVHRRLYLGIVPVEVGLLRHE